ncbi:MULTISPECIES: hypothetical protein [Methylobacterium]|nr:MULTISPECIES: hypothetical protein [Methylobacterium]
MIVSVSTSAPPPRLKIKLDPDKDESRELFMSFGLLNEISALVGGVEGVPNLSFDPQTALTALEIVLAPRDERGAVLSASEAGSDAISVHHIQPEVAEQILDWIGAHALDFFVRRFDKSATLLASNAAKLQAVASSLTSSGNSAGKTA